MAHTYITPVANPKSSRNLSGMMLYVVIGSIITVVIGATFLLLSASNNITPKIDRLNARIVILQKIIAIGKKNAVSPDLQKITTDASILLSGDVPLLQTAAKAAGANGKNKEIITAEADADSLKRLETAAINGQFDDMYSPILKTKLESTLSLLQTLRIEAKNKNYKTAADKTYIDLSTILKALKQSTL